MKLRAAVIVSIVFGAASVYIVTQFFGSLTSTSSKSVVYSIDNTRIEGAGTIPNVNLGMLKFKNESANFMSNLREKYGPIHFSGINARDTTLTTEESNRVEQCMKKAKADLGRSNSIFWGKQEHIRTRNHTYLKNENAVMIEVGGNWGGDAARFVELYNPRYVILEPLEEYANILKKKFKDNSRMTVVNLGLGEKTEVVMVKIDGNNACATSKFSGSGGETPLYIVNATEFLLKLGVGVFDVDLLTMNCEGCEFETMETITSTTLVNHFRNIQFATHSTIPVPDAVKRYCRIQELLARTHRPVYQYKLLWESWRRKDVP